MTCAVCGKLIVFSAPRACGHSVCQTCSTAATPVTAAASSSSSSAPPARVTRRALKLAEQQALTDAAVAACPVCETCPICTEPFEKRSKLDSCQHQFCFGCVMRLSETVNECPICRAKFTCVTPLDGSGAKRVRKRDLRKFQDDDDDDEQAEIRAREIFNDINGLSFHPLSRPGRTALVG